jgi:hypothetical protein
MLFPLYVTPEEGGITGRSPLVPDFKFRGADLRALFDDVRGILPTVAAPIAENPADVIRNAEGYEGGEWLAVPIGEAAEDNPSKRFNLSLPVKLVAQIDAKAEDLGLTRSGWIAQAARAQLARGG